MRDRQKLESLLFFYYHKIEKALTLPEVRPLFGLSYIETVLDLMDRWVCLTGGLEAVVFRGAYASLVHYREHGGESLTQKRPDLARRLDQFLADHKEPDENFNLGGTITVATEELQAGCQTVDFERFVHQRHSVRNFTKRHIPDSAIIQAAKLAQRSPSVCNRQCWRVHVFTSSADKAKVLQQQSGNVGFGHLADRVLLVTADLRGFVSSGERNQAYTDAGMFAMTLLYALQAQGIASCCLNLSISFHQDRVLRRVCKIPEWEIPIMMIAVGYPPESLQVAISARVPTQSILYFRDLGAEVDQ
jgi:nitroreductase